MPNFYRFRYVGTAVLLLLGLFLLVAPALAQDSAITDDAVNDVAKDLYCPVCENTPWMCAPHRHAPIGVNSFGSSFLMALRPKKCRRTLCANMVRACSLIPKEGFNLILWVFPVAAVLLGGVFFSRYVSSLRASAAGGDEAFEEDVTESSNIPKMITKLESKQNYAIGEQNE